MTAETAEPARNLTELGESRLLCLWLTRIDPVLPDAGDLTYSFHLLVEPKPDWRAAHGLGNGP